MAAKQSTNKAPESVETKATYVEHVDEVNSSVTAAGGNEPAQPIAEPNTQTQGVPVAEPNTPAQEAPAPATISVNRDALYRLLYAVVVHPGASAYSGIGAITKIGEIFGAKDYSEALGIWKEIQEFINGGGK